MNLVIDYRESKIIQLIKETSGYNYTVENLTIGDMLIKRDDHLQFIIERKSVQDLSSSIIDNRFREQKQRLIESINDPYKIIYIIEGDKSNIKNLPKKTINSALINLSCKHKFHVIYTINYQDTLDIILGLYSKINENKLEISKESHNTFLKKSDKIHKNIMVNMLSIIPGVSVNIAQKIVEKYPTFAQLMHELTPETLVNIQVTEKRKVGKAISNKIYNVFNSNLEI